jgi:hypothetical protein
MSLSNLIIVGGMRSGTTSLFRYLCNSKEIAASHVKELNFFVDYDINPSHYKNNFSINNISKYTLESSPVYFAQPECFLNNVANFYDLNKVIPIFIFRNKLERMESVYYSTIRSGVISDVSLKKFLQDAVSNDSDLSYVSSGHRDYMDGVLNLGQKRALEIVQDSGLFKKVLWVDFDDLRSDPASLVSRLASLLGVDSFEFDYEIENQSIVPKFPNIYRAALVINSILEPFLNRVPRVRSFIRGVHHKINNKGKDEFVDEALQIECQKEDETIRSILNGNSIFVKV